MELLELVGGLIVPAAAVVLALDLEARGHRVQLHPDSPDRITVSRGAALTAADKAALTTYRRHLAALAAYSLAPPAPVVRLQP